MKVKEENIFLYVMLIVGILVIFLTPPIMTPDEETHFANIYSIGTGNIIPDLHEGGIGWFLPEEVDNFITTYKNMYVGQLKAKYSFATHYYDSWLPNPHKTNLVYRNMGELAQINPSGYMVSVAGVAFGNLILQCFDGNNYVKPYNLLLFARMFNAVFYVVVGYFALKLTPIFKRTMLIILLMPISIFLGVSVSYDAILISIATLFFGNTMKIILSEKNYQVLNSDIFITLISTFFLVGIKMAYAPFILLLFFIPKEKFGSKKRYITCIALTIITAVLVYFGYQLMLMFSMHGYVPKVEESIILQRKFLASHLNLIPTIIRDTFNANRVFYLQSFFGNLGQLDTNFPVPLTLMFYVVLFVVFLYEACSISYKISYKIRILNSILVIISLLGIFGSMYLGWTPLVLEVGGTIVTGVQGRYFIPLFLFMCFCFSNALLFKVSNFKNRYEVVADITTRTIIIINATCTCIILLLRYWV